MAEAPELLSCDDFGPFKSRPAVPMPDGLALPPSLPKEAAALFAQKALEMDRMGEELEEEEETADENSPLNLTGADASDKLRLVVKKRMAVYHNEQLELKKLKRRRNRFGGQNFRFAFFPMDSESEETAASFNDELNFDRVMDISGLHRDDLVKYKKLSSSKKTIASFCTSAVYHLDELPYLTFLHNINNECRGFADSLYPFVLTFCHNDSTTHANCQVILNILRSLSWINNERRTRVMNDLLFGPRNPGQEACRIMNMPVIVLTGGNVALDPFCDKCVTIERITEHRLLPLKYCRDREEFYVQLMEHPGLKESLLHTALVTYNLIMCGLYGSVEGMGGHRGFPSGQPDDDCDHEYLSD